MARPRFRPKAAQRRKVSVAAGGGWSHEEIAIALGISRPTLEKYFEYELSIGAYERRMEAIQGLHRAAKKGNVAAAKAYAALSVKASAPPPAVDGVATSKPQGKKEQADEKAKTAQVGTEWAELLEPQSRRLQ